MISYEDKSNCQNAKEYYYAYLTGNCDGDIPSHVINHIDNCDYCSGQISKLQAELESIEQTSEEDSILLSNLELHFNYIGEPISCNIAKPFLPVLACHSTKINIRTPITDHIDKCRSCSDDLKMLLSLHLTDTQLYILGQIFALYGSFTSNECEDVLQYMDRIINFDYKNIPSDIQKHICTCAKCREILQNGRKGLLINVGTKPANPALKCQAIENTDLFHYIVPCGFNIHESQSEFLESPLAEHLIRCKECRQKLEKLDDNIFSIIQRPNSDNVSIFRPNDALLYEEDKPVDVPREFQSKRFSFLKPLTAAAAVIMVIAFMFFKSSAVDAVDLKHMYKALSNIQQVHVINYQNTDNSVIDEMWISPVLNIKAIKNSRESALWDVGKKQLTIKKPNTDSKEVISVDRMQLTQIRSTMQAPWTLMPFNRAEDIPNNAVWKHIEDESIVSQYINSEVYDLIWDVKTSGQKVISYKIRCSINTDSCLPMRIEFYDKIGSNYELVNFREIEYLSSDQFKRAIENLGF